MRTYDKFFPQQFLPTVGPTRKGVEIQEGAQGGMEGIIVGRMIRSRRDKLYIDTAEWGPEPDSFESGYRVPIRSIQVFIGPINRSEPEPDLDVPTKHSRR